MQITTETHNATRRRFLRGMGGALALTLEARHYRALGGVPPSERINVGFIGVGGMGTVRLQAFLHQRDVNAVAVCDVDETHRNRAAALVEQSAGRKAVVYADFRRLLENRDVDAVMIATPDHWHALPAVFACHAGKDVFIEKPLSYSIGEGRAMVTAARMNNRITQMGNHVHNDFPNHRRVVEMVRSGRLGRIDRVFCWKRSTAKGIGNPPDSDPPVGLDYDFWLGPAPHRPYNPNRSHFNFRYFWDYSGGEFMDFWCHITDVVYWAFDLAAPRSVTAVGRRDLSEDNAETPNLLDVIYDLPELILTWTVHPGGFPSFEHLDPGCMIRGTAATLVCGYRGYDIFVDGKPAPDFPRPAPTIHDSPGHIREFLDAVKSRNRTSCDVEYAHRLNKGGLLGSIAYQVGRRVYWDDATERIRGDADADRLVKRRYRKPWRIA